MENTLLNLIPAAYLPEIHLSQYDTGRTITFTLKDGASDYSVPSGASVKVKATKPSGFGFEVACTFNGGTVTLVTTETMTPENGRFPAELSIVSGNTTIGTSNFIFNIERSPHPEGTIDGDAETILPELTLLVERVETAASSVLDMQVVANTLPSGSQATYSYNESLNKATFGIPQGEPGAGAVGTVANAYDSSKTYAVGDYAIHNNDLYRCRTAITTAEAFTASHWTKIVLADDVTALKSELADIRVGANGLTYPNAGDAVREQIDEVKRDISIISDAITTLSFGDLAINDEPKKYIYIPKGKIVTVSATNYDTTSIRVSFYYTDGTSVTSIKLSDKLRYRAEKDIKAIRIYTSIATNVTVTVTDEQLYITNYYDKANKISGWINNASIASGYYHFFLPVAIGEKLIFSGYQGTFGAPRLYFYDENDNYMGRVNGTAREDGLYEVNLGLSAIGASFVSGNIFKVGFNMSTAGSDTAVFYKESVPYSLVAYGEHLPTDQALLFNQKQKDYIANNGGSALAGKLIAYNGDSIAESRISAGNTYNGGGYPKMIADLTGGTYENRAHGGGILASQAGDGGSAPARCVVSDVTNMTDDADLICFEGGINDYWRDVPLGTYTESDYSSTLDTTTICGALESIFRQAKVKWVGKPICFVITHKIKSTVYVDNDAGYDWTDVHEKIVGICKKYAIPYYDAFEDSGLNAYDDVQNTNFLTSNSSGTADGCHPNALGYEKYYVPQLIALFEKIMPRD